MNTSESGLRFIAVREACVLVAYADGKGPDGQKYSIGFGSQDPMPLPGDTITVTEALARLRQNLDGRDISIGRRLKVEITQGQWDACASLYYQAGSRALNAVCNHLNAGQHNLAATEFCKWASGQDGKPTEGHAKRRLREQQLFRFGDYGDISKYLRFDGNPRLVPGIPTLF